ncbi:MAG: histidine--tRNA ligase [Archaeoglobaceae archaeon]|nr:histidine--tRNA ligase [Archaeoglobaceae archaeon]MDW8118451.1 histidine--tRNA ligase [Archaeoglobaceae archaeon]
MKIERPRGTRDFLPEEMEKRRVVERKLREIAESYGYREVSTPTFEHSELFKIKSGEGIVEEMYVFEDKSGRELSLRPELTAPIMRFFVNDCILLPKPIRFYYFGNCFRYERPQKGRYREFWQFGVELIGSDSYLADAEVISLADKMLKSLKIDYELHIGHVGILRSALSFLGDKASKVMRLIDKRDEEGLNNYLNELGVGEDLKDKIKSIMNLKGGREIIEDAKKLLDYNFDYIERLLDIIDSLKIKYTLNLGVARGLDYYTGIVFEFYAKDLGAQKQICGGGSYELAQLLGGIKTPATGFAIGFDRVCELLEGKSEKGIVVVVAYFKGFEKIAFEVAEELRDSGFTAVIDVMERNLKKQLSYANDINADLAIIIGEEEIKKGEVSVKDLKTGEQFSIPRGELTTSLLGRLRKEV